MLIAWTDCLVVEPVHLNSLRRLILPRSCLMKLPLVVEQSHEITKVVYMGSVTVFRRRNWNVPLVNDVLLCNSREGARTLQPHRIVQ